MEHTPTPRPGSDITPQSTSTRHVHDHERRDASIRGILWFAFILTLVIVLAQLGLGAWMTFFHSEEEKVKVRRPELFDEMVGQYPGPRLQDNPARDMETYSRAEDIRLNNYGWVEPRKVARIPIKRAIDLLVERGLPKVPPPASNLPGPPLRPESDSESPSDDRPASKAESQQAP